MHFPVRVCCSVAQAGTKKNIAHSRSLPFAVHHRCISPIYTFHFMKKSPHCEAAVAGAFQGADDFILREFAQLL